jgi:hypothetical protein
VAISSLGQRTTTFTVTTTACVEYRTAAAETCLLIEQSFISQASATAMSIGLGRSAAVGVTPVPVVFQRDNPADPASLTVGSLSWATSPTVPAQFIRRWSCGATQGVGVVWIFPRGLRIPVSSSLVLWNITATVGADVNCIVDD